MTKRFVRIYEKLRDRLGGRAKLALAIVGIWIAVEIIAAVTIAILGADWLASGGAIAKSDPGGLAMTLSAPRFASANTVF